MIDNSSDEVDFLNKSLLSERQIVRFCKDFAKKSSVNIKLSRTQTQQTQEFMKLILARE